MNLISKDPDGWLYGKTAIGTLYKCMEYHRRPLLPDKTLWSEVSRPEEAGLFEEAETAQWIDADGHHWWTAPDLDREIGSEGELCAFFPCRRNPADPAHGYPVTGSRHATRAVPKAIARAWEDQGRIRPVDRLRLKGRKL